MLCPWFVKSARLYTILILRHVRRKPFPAIDTSFSDAIVDRKLWFHLLYISMSRDMIFFLEALECTTTILCIGREQRDKSPRWERQANVSLLPVEQQYGILKTGRKNG